MELNRHRFYVCACNYECAHVYSHRKPWTKASDVCFPPFPSSYHKQKQLDFWSQCMRKAEYRVDSGQEVVQKVSALGNVIPKIPMRRRSIREGQTQKWGSGKEESGGLN